MKYIILLIRYVRLLRLGFIAIILLPVALVERFRTKQKIKNHRLKKDQFL